MADIPLLITSENASSERRVTPSWSIAHLKGRLEPITGIPATCQRLRLQIASQAPRAIEAADEDATLLQQWPLQPYAEIHVLDTRPPGARQNYTDPSAVEKFTLDPTTYAARPDTVLAYKRAHQLGRFDPAAPSLQQQKIDHSFREARERNVVVDARCQLLPDSDGRRGTVRYVGAVEGLPGVGCWVGVELDEPTGRNDGCVDGVRVFECKAKCGVFVRPERVEVGEFGVLDEFAEDGEEF